MGWVLCMSIESEATLENKLISKLVDEGYEKITIVNEKDLINNLKIQLEKFNKTTFTDEEFNKILLYLEGGSVFDKAKKLRDKFPLERKEGTKYVSFFNSEEWCKNIFQVTHQITIKGKFTNRYDVTLLINGMPLAQIELKRRGVELKSAFNQINRYQAHSFHGLFNYVQIFIISNGVNTKYYANNKKLSFKYTFFWKDEENRNITNLNEFTEVFLEKCHLSKMIARYVVLNESTRSLMVLRAYQYYAVERILDHALEAKQNGYVWHTTGSGKTLTSFKTAQLLTQENSIDKVIFVVDRKDLDYQTTKEFNSFCDNAVDGTDSTFILIKQLTGPNKLIITTIQKLDRAVKKHGKRLKSVKDKHLVLMFDECHRSQFGDMHKRITDYFTNIQYYGFTGTPIFAVNANNKRTTKDIFGKRLHSYIIKDAIHDDNVLGFLVEYVGRFKNKTQYDIEVEAINTREVMESEDRIGKIVDYIITHHDQKTFDREFTSILAVSSIEVLHKYYKIFKEKDHDLKIATIYSYTENQEHEENKLPRDKLDEYIGDYNKMFKTNYSSDTFGEYYVDVSKRSKDKQIDILLVVNMFLTGFDNKYLNTLYVDKNLAYHNLIQAFSRTNRVLNDKKKQGNIICFRNLKQETDDAIRLYSDETALEDVLIGEYEEYVKKFNKALDYLFKITPTVDSVDDLESEDDILNFVKTFRKLLRIMNRLGIFNEFTFDDLEISEQTFEDFKGKYVDLIPDSPLTPTSVLNDIDFEIDLIRRDKINVSYILTLLEDLDRNNPSFETDIELILDTLRKSPELKSKVQLIEEFIEKTIIEENNTKDVTESFEEFMDNKKENAILDLSQKRDLDEDAVKDLISGYEFTGKLKNEGILNSLKGEMGFLQRKALINDVRGEIVNLVDMFSW